MQLDHSQEYWAIFKGIRIIDHNFQYCGLFSIWQLFKVLDLKVADWGICRRDRFDMGYVEGILLGVMGVRFTHLAR